jgi:internalin A
MSDLDLIYKLGERLGRPLQQLSEAQFERHAQAKATRNWNSPNLIKRDAYCLGADGTVSGLFLQPLTSQLLVDFPFHQFGSVKHLYLSQVNLPSYDFLGNLTGLTSLDLSNNQISDISVLSTLTGLTSLDLRSNQISDISVLSTLTGLTSLDLRSNQISDYSVLSTLTGLTSLDLSNNPISDYSVLSTLTSLTSLALSDNEISDISVLSTLTGLTSLDLSNNQISDISVLSTLTGLMSLDLSYNQIEEVPRKLAEGRLAITTDQLSYAGFINLSNNPIETPPLEIVSQGNEAILSYYAQTETQGQDHLYEAKMLIVGEGEAGKTTLAHKIAEPNCPLPHIDDRTRGISIQTHSFTCRDRNPSEAASERNFHLNVWDFGGQEIYHYTHRFFLSKRSLYVLVADNRKDDTDFNYWLNIIELFAGNSPLIIVLNEKGDVQRTLNQADLRGRYSESIKEILSVNFKTYEEDDSTKAEERLKGIYRLIGEIEHCAQNLPHIGEPVPARWVNVRQAIEQDDRNTIYREQFDELCEAQDITQPQDIDTLLGYFHDLGILLHFADNPLLRDRVILNPTWATNAVYRIFDDNGINAKAGRFTRDDCANLWSDGDYRRMHDILIELMKNFQLVYEIENTGQLVAPQLLPQNTPAYDWEDAHNSHMQLRYDAFMPKGIFWQFAVRMYRYIHNHDWVWRNGMVIRRGNTWAEVKEDLQARRIYLRFRGPSIAEFRAVVVDELDRINQTYHRLDYDKMIPCQCSVCRDSQSPHFFKYSFLKRRQEAGKRSEADCEISDEVVPLKSLLDGFDEDIIQKLPDKKGAEPTPPELSSTYETPALNQTSANSRPMSNQNDTAIRIALAKFLSAIPQPQFEELLFVVAPPPGIISPGAQKNRVGELLTWVNGPNGMGFQQLLEVMESLGIPCTVPATASAGQPQSSSSQQAPLTSTTAGSQSPQSGIKTNKIFLASSNELREDRDKFDLYFRQQNDRLLDHGLYLKIVRWENGLDAMSNTRLQDEYNKRIRDCDIFVSLFKTKTGKYTEEEFDVAHQTFQATGQPIIYTYFQKANVSNSAENRKDLISLWDFQAKLEGALSVWGIGDVGK